MSAETTETPPGAHGCSLRRMVRRWYRDADQYQSQVEEARAKGLPHDQRLSMMTCLRACAKELQVEMNKMKYDSTRRP